ncbi:MAG: pathogenicity locus [Saprospiraceae bacterium]|nr:pathogenicity locus [Saprospiraceae bacterium]
MKQTNSPHTAAIKALTVIPGVGKSIANDLWNIGYASVAELRGKDPQALYDQSNRFAGIVQDRCLLYVFRCPVYFAETPPEEREPELLKWWNWKERT